MNNSHHSAVENLKILQHVSLEPLVAFEDPRDFWIDGMRVKPIYDLELSVPLYQKISGSNIFYRDDLARLCLKNIRKRCGLSENECEELTIALHRAGISLPEHDEMNLGEFHANLRETYADEIKYLAAMVHVGSPDAALFMAKLATEGILQEDDEPLYRKAIELGSGQAANDFAALLMRSKSYDPEIWKEIVNLLDLASRKGCKNSERNLACMNQIKKG